MGDMFGFRNSNWKVNLWVRGRDKTKQNAATRKIKFPLEGKYNGIVVVRAMTDNRAVSWLVGQFIHGWKGVTWWDGSTLMQK